MPDTLYTTQTVGNRENNDEVDLTAALLNNPHESTIFSGAQRHPFIVFSECFVNFGIPEQIIAEASTKCFP